MGLETFKLAWKFHIFTKTISILSNLLNGQTIGFDHATIKYFTFMSTT